MIKLLFFLTSLSSVKALDYFGIWVGRLRNSSFALDGQVYIANSSYLQITNLNIKRLINRDKLQFIFFDENRQQPATTVYEYKESDGGEWLRK
uniref:DUF4488 domain-containing protein n=1 Tax=Heterorhabditis bacteriophora TaxID=37862 RepID=A0A1I7WJK6_HETBA